MIAPPQNWANIRLTSTNPIVAQGEDADLTGLGRILIYTHKTDAMVAFYCRHFGFRAVQHPGDRIIELQQASAGPSLMLHPAAKGQRDGQSTVKLVFDVVDVPGFIAQAAEQGLVFGPVHHADGYDFANAKDPSGNSVSVSSRAFAGPPAS